MGIAESVIANFLVISRAHTLLREMLANFNVREAIFPDGKKRKPTASISVPGKSTVIGHHLGLSRGEATATPHFMFPQRQEYTGKCPHASQWERKKQFATLNPHMLDQSNSPNGT